MTSLKRAILRPAYTLKHALYSNGCLNILIRNTQNHFVHENSTFSKDMATVTQPVKIAKIVFFFLPVHDNIIIY